MRLVKRHCNVLLPFVGTCAKTSSHLGSQHPFHFCPWADKAELVTLKQWSWVNAASDCQCWHRNTIRAVALADVGILRLKLNAELSALQEKEWLSDKKVIKMAGSRYICHNSLVTGNYSCSSHRWFAQMIKLLSTTSQIAVKRLNWRRIADPVLLMTKNSVTALIERTACEAVWLLWSCLLAHNATCSGIDQPIKWVLEF